MNSYKERIIMMIPYLRDEDLSELAQVFFDESVKRRMESADYLLISSKELAKECQEEWNRMSAELRGVKEKV